MKLEHDLLRGAGQRAALGDAATQFGSARPSLWDLLSFGALQPPQVRRHSGWLGQAERDGAVDLLQRERREIVTNDLGLRARLEGTINQGQRNPSAGKIEQAVVALFNVTAFHATILPPSRQRRFH